MIRRGNRLKEGKEDNLAGIRGVGNLGLLNNRNYCSPCGHKVDGVHKYLVCLAKLQLNLLERRLCWLDALPNFVLAFHPYPRGPPKE